jgi:signal transduction histidine kinase
VTKVTTMHRQFTSRPRPGSLIDVLLAALAFGGTLAVIDHGFTVLPGSDAEPQNLDAVSGLLAACASLPLVARRRNPGAVFTLTAAASTLLAVLDYAVGVPLGATAALYALAASRGDRDPWTARTTATVVGLLVAYLTATGIAQGEFPGSQLFHTALAWGVAWFAGERSRLQREHIAELRDRAQRAEREAERERRLAVAEERARIARDLHDSAGHAINVIAVRAGAARLSRDAGPDRAQRALAEIEDLSRQTVEEIDQIVGTLRDDHAGRGSPTAPPGLASLDTLVAHHASTGLDITVSTSGSPRPLATTLDQAAYRILQEALTNAARHGAGTADVALRFDDCALDLTVTNPVRANGAARSGGGHGLAGMRERAALVGGSLHATDADVEFHLHAHLPYRIDRR